MPKVAERWFPVVVDINRLTMSLIEGKVTQVSVNGENRFIKVTYHNQDLPVWVGLCQNEIVHIRPTPGGYEICFFEQMAIDPVLDAPDTPKVTLGGLRLGLIASVKAITLRTVLYTTLGAATAVVIVVHFWPAIGHYLANHYQF